MLNKLNALVFALLIALLFERGYAAYKWKQLADERGKLAQVSAQYLFSETPVKKDGKPLTRAELLDLLLAKALSAPPSAASAEGRR